MDKRAEKTCVTAERVLQELAAMALYDVSELTDAFRKTLTSVEQLRELPEPLRRAIIGYKWDKDGRLVLTLADKARALELIGKHLKLFTDKIEHSADESLEAIVEAAFRRGRPTR